MVAQANKTATSKNTTKEKKRKKSQFYSTHIENVEARPILFATQI